MLRKIGKILLGIVLVLLLIAGGFFVFAMSLVKKLPWQKPVFETVRPPDPGTIGEKGVLVFSKTNGFRHESIEPGIAAIQKAGQERGWKVAATENGAFFNDDYLNRFKVVVFMSTTGDILTPEQEKSFEKFVENGGGYVGVHSACDTEYEWQWYDQLLGTHFRDHTLYPDHTPEAELVTEVRDHATTRHLPERWQKSEEWYNFNESIRGKEGFQVLLSVNESTYKASMPKAMGGDHPISWTNQPGKGRMFYTALGHTPETFTDAPSWNHILEGIAWSGRL
ncbi:ThuA domain-containing protein [Rhodocytophaga rosea]|uniref:ThuA domain-containing protein n=1 Tax=Rhodocytophaga rosea TaxID=2704465 RepID=A0A6C0GPT0_9BACT|nr:ThuA domain-containing protein [Rhodocytophaga rosea]QHT70059.1 ThuA domain-containing protein [Rhodocytophaga rosea]